MASPQPAKKSYFFDKGYRDLYHTIRGAWRRNYDSVLRYVELLRNAQMEDTTLRIFLSIVYILAIVSVVVCGSVITALITLANVVVLVIVMAALYLAFSLIWLIDRLYLVGNGIFSPCTSCKERSLIPTYICPTCQAKHDRLTPGVYGILMRRCSCGTKLPCTFFNGRRELRAECPNCGQVILNRESRPICIPVVGGRSVGKTAFINAFSREFIEGIAPEKGLGIELYDDQRRDIYQEITRDFASGSTRMTQRPQSLGESSSESFSFFVKSPLLSPDRLIHVYDVAGEVFTDNMEHEVQRQYQYCHGIVLILDPFSIPRVRNQYEDMLSPEDAAGISRAGIHSVMDAFVNKLREVTGMSDNEMAKAPLAVVINKIDSPGIRELLGPEAVTALMDEDPMRFGDYYDAQDYLCRRFLAEHDMESVLNMICSRFPRNRFFACSAIGHARDQGSYEPEGVMAPMEWLIRDADPTLGRIWNDNAFTRRPLALEERN